MRSLAAEMKARNGVRSSAVLVAAMLLTAPARAEEGPPLVPGQRVRVTTAAPGPFTGATVGTLVKIGPDSPVERLRVTLRPERGGGRVALTFSF